MAAGCKRILIVEDDPALSLVMRYRLSKAGFELVQARDGRAAWETTRREHFDLIVTDEQMPEMTGTELCRQLRQDPRYANTPIVMVTAKALELEMTHARELLGLAALVTKPFSPNRFVSIIEKCLADEPAGDSHVACEESENDGREGDGYRPRVAPQPGVFNNAPHLLF